MFEVRASTEIDASAHSVWSVLTDFAGYHAWNPFIRAARGAAAVGARVRVRVRPSFGGRLGFRAIVRGCQRERELHWEGHVIAPWLAHGDHSFTIEPLGEGRVRLVQRERFSGLVPRIAGRLLAREARRGFDAMNDALAARARAVEALRTGGGHQTEASRQ